MGLLASVPELSARTRQAFVVGVWFSHFFAGSAPSRCLFLEPSDDLLGPLSWSSAFLASASFILLNRCYFLVQTITRCVVLALLLLFNFQELSFDVVLGSCLFREECPAGKSHHFFDGVNDGPSHAVVTRVPEHAYGFGAFIVWRFHRHDAAWEPTLDISVLWRERHPGHREVGSFAHITQLGGGAHSPWLGPCPGSQLRGQLRSEPRLCSGDGASGCRAGGLTPELWKWLCPLWWPQSIQPWSVLCPGRHLGRG